MRRDPRAFLWDVREAARDIQTFTADLDASGFEANPMAHAAVERKFEVIGEALSQLGKTDAALAARIPDLAQIVGFRNQLIHGYATVRVSTVWNIVRTSLPPLLEVVDALLGELGTP
jgi:uncharacterized protein with HEPN domain